jgi:hypothetical protein
MEAARFYNTLHINLKCNSECPTQNAPVFLVGAACPPKPDKPEPKR